MKFFENGEWYKNIIFFLNSYILPFLMMIVWTN